MKTMKATNEIQYGECETCGFLFIGSSNAYREYCDICNADMASDGTTEAEVISVLDQIGIQMSKK